MSPPSHLPSVPEAPLSHFRGHSLSGACSSFLPGLMSLDTLALASWPCVPSLGLACHSGVVGPQQGETQVVRGGRALGPSGTGGRDRLEMGSHCPNHVAQSRPPASQASPLSHRVGTSGSPGHSKLSRDRDSILSLSPRHQVLLSDRVTVMVSVSPTSDTCCPILHSAPIAWPTAASLTWYLDGMWFTSVAYPPPPRPAMRARWGQGRQAMADMSGMSLVLYLD